jgi:hypothetical protein
MNKRVKIILPRFGNAVVGFLQSLERLAVKTQEPTKSERLLLKQHSISKTQILENMAVNELLALKKQSLEELVPHSRLLTQSLEQELQEVQAKLSALNLRRVG